MGKDRAFVALVVLTLIGAAARGEAAHEAQADGPACPGETAGACVTRLMNTAGLALPSNLSGETDRSAETKALPAESSLPPVAKARNTRAVAIFIAQRKIRKLRDEVVVAQFTKNANAGELKAVEDAAAAIEAAAADAGVDEPFHAELVSGLITSRADTNPTEEQGQTLGAYVRWSSRSFMVRSTDLENEHSSVRIAGRFGRAPVTALLAEPGADIKATEIPAFVWDARAEWRRHGDRTDWLMYGGAGQNWLVSESVAAKGSAGQQVLMLSGGKVAWNFEAGFAVNAFREGRFERLAGLDAEPRFSLSVGYRKDTLLADAKKFGKNEDRLVIRMVLAQLRIFDKREGAEKPGPFTLRFGVEHERGLTSRGAPSATRLLIAGDLNIVEALK